MNTLQTYIHYICIFSFGLKNQLYSGLTTLCLKEIGTHRACYFPKN